MDGAVGARGHQDNIQHILSALKRINSFPVSISEMSITAGLTKQGLMINDHVFSSIQGAFLPLDPIELNAIQFIAKQYGIDGIDFTGANICSSPSFTCLPVGQASRIQHINLDVTTFKPLGQPDVISEFPFAMLKTFRLKAANQVANPSINILNLIVQLDYLVDLSIINDPSITSIPIIFPNEMLRLETIIFDNCTNLTHIDPFFDSLTDILSLSIKRCPINRIVINETTSLPFLTTLDLDLVDSTSDSNPSGPTASDMLKLSFGLSSFPKLSLLVLSMTGNGNPQVILKSDLLLLSQVNLITTGTGTGGFKLVPQNPSIIKNIAIIGNSYIEAFTASSYTSLLSLNYLSTQLISYPWTSGSFTTLKQLGFKDSQFSTIPSTPIIPSMLNYLNFKNNVLTTIEWQAFQGIFGDSTSLFNLGLDLSDNSNLVTTIPNSMCNNIGLLDIRNTSITELPSCLICYLQDTDHIQTDIIMPPNYSCDITIVSTLLVLDNRVGIIQGSLLGFGIISESYKTLPIVPQTKLKIIWNNYLYTEKTNYQISFSQYYPEYTKTLDVIEAACPYLTSAQYDHDNHSIISLFGNFGSSLSHVSVQLNNSIPCKLESVTSKLIVCLLLERPNLGLTDVKIQVNNIDYLAVAALCFKNHTHRTEQQCLVNNCYQRGHCEPNGRCICDDLSYNPDDDCLTKYANITFNPNTTAPTTSFDIDGVGFQFEMVAIQELDIDESVINELFTNSGDWESTITTNTINNDTDTLVVYKHNASSSSSSSLTSHRRGHRQIHNNNNINITATLSYSTRERQVEFASHTLHLHPNTVKMTVYIENWTYVSSVSTLRAVFRTRLNSQSQLIDIGCDQPMEITPLQFGSLSSSLQYLRVVKDSVQFNSRFVDYVVSDGKTTFSKTIIINQTTVEGSPDQLSTLIGINLPQCASCVIDPDFTPLTIDNHAISCGRNSQVPDTWKIVVGCVVGGVAAVAAAIGGIFLWKTKKQQKNTIDSGNMKLKELQY
ncbi:hypothetical protein DFA_09594 [Cavenderia fasciculata]|uniref:ComC supersandwich domain-containing protein n=1 Tax=Cavenderia fasciculata TaxID=261658 RepID=F4Q823_CACFS|nr:uncharacterized protein DFA_09594 [Cavenderia fasciculata]EGG15923.1 hypothetical protein DFA_09594 [Cavenderia fasciculata]|eukprot:XP_004352248.1 hypothetical protein DFA_09594 [Cavenderia fasciculata]